MPDLTLSDLARIAEAAIRAARIPADAVTTILSFSLERPSITLSATTRKGFDTATSNRLANHFAPTGAYSEHGGPHHPYGVLTCITANDVEVMVHCAPRMTAAEVEAEFNG